MGGPGACLTLARMSAPQQLTDQQRAQLLRGHYSLRRRDMVRYWQLSEQDLRRVNARRRRHNRLGFAVQLCLLRYPGWPLNPTRLLPRTCWTTLRSNWGSIQRRSLNTQPATDPAANTFNGWRGPMGSGNIGHLFQLPCGYTSDPRLYPLTQRLLCCNRRWDGCANNG